MLIVNGILYAVKDEDIIDGKFEVPEGVKAIGRGAFRDCSALTSITLPEGLESIGIEAFFGCSGLTSITLPEGLESIGTGAFERCSGLTSVTLSGGVKIIGCYAFSYCSGLTSITLPEGLESIGEYAFVGCSKLNLIVVDSDKPVELERIRNLLPVELRDKVISSSALHELNEIKLTSLKYFLYQNPHTNPVSRELLFNPAYNAGVEGDTQEEAARIDKIKKVSKVIQVPEIASLITAQLYGLSINEQSATQEGGAKTKDGYESLISEAKQKINQVKLPIIDSIADGVITFNEDDKLRYKKECQEITKHYSKLISSKFDTEKEVRLEIKKRRNQSSSDGTAVPLGSSTSTEGREHQQSEAAVTSAEGERGVAPMSIAQEPQPPEKRKPEDEDSTGADNGQAKKRHKRR